jgi:uncharacterized membrane protein (UPF0127 family)
MLQRASGNSLRRVLCALALSFGLLAVFSLPARAAGAMMPNIYVQPLTIAYIQNQTATALMVTADVDDGGTLSY